MSNYKCSKYEKSAVIFRFYKDRSQKNWIYWPVNTENQSFIVDIAVGNRYTYVAFVYNIVKLFDMLCDQTNKENGTV